MIYSPRMPRFLRNELIQSTQHTTNTSEITTKQYTWNRKETSHLKKNTEITIKNVILENIFVD
jgi:hypothetical protein